MAKSFDNIRQLVVGEFNITQDQKKSYKITMTGDALKFLHRSNASDNFVINKDGSFTLPSTLETSPTSPASGGIVYVKSDGKLYFKNSSGAEYNLTDTGEAGDITGVTAGVGLSGGGTTGDVSLALDVSELTALGTTAATGDYVVIQDVTDNSTKKVLVSNLPSSGGGATLSNGVDNRVVTAAGASSLNGEANLTFDTQLHITRGTTVGDIGGITLGNAALKITDSSTNMYIDGNSINTDANTYVNVSANYDLYFGTNNVERVRIKNNGLVGIGTSSPNAGLHIDVADEPQLLLDGGDDDHGDIVVPTGEILQMGHWDDAGNTYTDRLKIKSDGVVAVAGELEAASLDISGDANIAGEIQTTKIAYTDGDDAVTVEDGGYLKFSQGNKYSDSVLVSSNYSSNHNYFIKFASYTDRDHQNTTETTFLVTTVGWEDSASHDGDGSFIVNVKYTYNTSSPYYFSTGTRVTCEAINGSTLNGFDPSTDVILTVGSAGADLYIKAKEQYKRCFVSILGGTNQNDTSVTDESWQILTGQSWAASITSQGTDIGGSWVDKTFKDVTAASLDISGDVDIDGTLETDALSINSTTVTATATELNYVDGVTSAIQTQLDAKHATIDSGNRLSATLIGANGNISNTEYGYLNGVSSNIQTQLDAKHATIDSGNRLSATLVGANGNISNTEYGYLNGVSSNIQTQIDSKAPTASPTFTGNATFDTDTLFVDSSNNKVGIGTTSPHAHLSIEGDHDGGVISLRMGGDNSSAGDFSARFEMTEDTNGSQVMTHGTFFEYDGDASLPHYGMLHIGMRDNSTSDIKVLSISRKATANSLFISGSGYVGIGTNNPQAPLDVLNGSTLLAQTIIDGVSTQFECQTASTTYKQINDDTDASKKASITFKVPASRKVMVTLRMAIRDYDASEHLWRVRITDSDSESTEGSWGSNFNDDQYNGHTEEHFGITTCQWYFDGTNATHNWTVGETKTMYFQIKVNSTIETIQIKAGNEYAPMSITAESVPANVTFVDMDN